MLVRLGWLGTYVQTEHDDRDMVVGQGDIPILHDQQLVISEARLAIDVGLSKRFGASLVLPLRLISTSIEYRDRSGAGVELVQPSTHHRNERLTGLADPMVLGSFTGALGSVRLTARTGVSVPLGRTEEDPYALGDMGMAHQHIQMGTGTFNPVVAAEASRGWNTWRLSGFLFTQQVVYESSKGYQAGDRYAAGVSLRRALGKWGVRGGFEVQAETAERWNGVTHTEEGNQGRFDAMLATGASWAATDKLSIDLALKIPFVTRAIGGQLDMPALLELGASWSFGGPAAKAVADEHEHGEEHDHDHDHAEHADDAHEDKVDTSGLDVVDLGPPGARIELVPVAGKLTIFDFWATWCEPCKTLEPALVELAKKYPERVAIRRIDAVDWDSAVVAQHLSPKGFGLPHLKIFDATGKLVYEQSSAPGKLEAMIEEVRALVEGGQPKVEAAKIEPKVETKIEDPKVDAPKVEQPPPRVDPLKPVKPKAISPAKFQVIVTEQGFEPKNVDVPRGKPVTLQFHRKTAKTCATEVVLDHDGKKIVKDLPLDKPVELTLTFTKAGAITYACAMNMIRGTITVKN